MLIISTIGVPFSGNKGSSSMLLSIIQNFDKENTDTHFNVFTYYPQRDGKKNSFPNVSVLSGTPLNLLVHLVPVSFLYFLFCKIGLKIPLRFLGNEIRVLLNSDLYLSVGGTTFTDAKLMKVVFNILCLLPAIFLNCKFILYTQTMGPFRKPLNRLPAKFILNQAELVIGRGRATYDHLKKLGLLRIDFAMDGAFSIESKPQDFEHIIKKYKSRFDGKTVVGISPNSIVEGACKKHGIEHARIFGEFSNYLIEKGYLPVLIPHSMKPGSSNRHNNDIPVIEDILRYIKKKDATIFIREDYTYTELRTLIGMTDYFVASRFHAMISALYTKRPVLVYGWGYQKYKEVMNEFELSDYVFIFDHMTKNNLIKDFDLIVKDSAIIQKRIEKNLPRVIEESRKAVKMIKTVMKWDAPPWY